MTSLEYMLNKAHRCLASEFLEESITYNLTTMYASVCIGYKSDALWEGEKGHMQ